MHGKGGHAYQRGACMAKGGHVWQRGGMHGKGNMCGKGVCDGGCAWQERRQGHMHCRGHAWQGVCKAGEMVTAADGTHPTGMHSCLKIKLLRPIQ